MTSNAFAIASNAFSRHSRARPRLKRRASANAWSFDGERATSPLGERIAYVSRPDVKFLYDEVFARETYGFASEDDDARDEDSGARRANERRCVVDVGANIGLSTVCFARQLSERDVVIAIEPISRTFDALVTNVCELVFKRERRSASSDASSDASATLDTEPLGGGPSSGMPLVYAYNVGVGARATASAAFTHFPRAAGWSTSSATRDDEETAENAEKYVFEALREDGELNVERNGKGNTRASSSNARSDGLEENAATAIGRFARRFILDEDAYARSTPWRRAMSSFVEFVLRWCIRVVVRFMLSGASVERRPVVTVSDVIERHRRDGDFVVDVLKIDVERGELDVLRGVVPEHWPIIQRVVLECHDIDGALEDAKRLLRSAGFADVSSTQPAALRGGTLHNIYASRRALARA